MKQNLLTRIRIRRRASVYKPHAAAGSGVCLCFELVFAPFLHIIGWLLINQSGALIICLFVYCCGLVFASFLLILPQIQCAKFLPFWSIFRGVLGILVISIKLIRLLLKNKSWWRICHEQQARFSRFIMQNFSSKGWEVAELN